MNKILLAMMLVGSQAMAHGPSTLNQYKKHVEQCIKDQTKLYGDLCFESIDTYKEKQTRHFQGVRCAAESIQACIDTFEETK